MADNRNREKSAGEMKSVIGKTPYQLVPPESVEWFALAMDYGAKKHKADLVAINPITNYMDGDCSRSEVAAEFFNALDRANPDDEWAWVLIHHTAKPPKQDDDKSQNWSSIYMGFGSSVFANRPRAAILIEPQGTHGEFVMHLGKGGTNAGVTKEVPHGVGTRFEATLKVPIRHTDRKLAMPWGEAPMFFWEPSDAAPEADKPARKGAGGAPPKYEREKILGCFPAASAPLDAVQIRRIANGIYESLTKHRFEEITNELINQGKVATVGEGASHKFYRT